MIAIVPRRCKDVWSDSLAAGLEKLGYRVERANAVQEAAGIPADLIVVWNGRNGTTWQDYAAEIGAKILYAEFGFFDRTHNIQLDKGGILHWSDWAKDIAIPCNTPKTIELQPMRPRAFGDIVILGQLDGDTQTRGSEITGHAHLIQSVSRALPDNMKAIFRPHPMHNNGPKSPCSNVTVSYQSANYANMAGTGLQEVFDNARFVIAINSNALVDATLSGCPALAFGPALGIIAGVYRKATVATLRDDIEAMLCGWCPSQHACDSFIAHLEANQYGSKTLADPESLAVILRKNRIHI